MDGGRDLSDASTRIHPAVGEGDTMKRRQFMKLSAAAGLSLLTPNARHALAAEELRGFEGPYWITVNLAGAWDTTLFCDPKGNQLFTSTPEKGPINHYGPDEIESFSFGGTTLPLGPGGPAGESMYSVTPSAGGQPVHILELLASQGLTIINGVDSGLTNHRSGSSWPWRVRLRQTFRPWRRWLPMNGSSTVRRT